MRRLFGYCALVLGGLGLLACLAGLVAVWLYREPALQAGLQGAEAVDEALQVAEEKARGAGEAVRAVRQAVGPAAKTVLRLAEKGPDDPDQQKKLRETAEDLRRQVHKVQSLLEVSRQAVDLINRTAKIGRKAPGIGSALENVPSPELGPKASQGLDQITGFLAELDQALAEPGKDQQTRIVLAEKLVALAKGFEDRTRDLQDRLDRMQSDVAALRERLAVVRTDLPGWTHLAVWILTAVLVWVGAGQGALLCLGRAILRGGSPPTNQPSLPA